MAMAIHLGQAPVLARLAKVLGQVQVPLPTQLGQMSVWAKLVRRMQLPVRRAKIILGQVLFEVVFGGPNFHPGMRYQ